MKQTCLFVFGGKSDEHEISLISAKGILDALDRSRFTPLLIGISRDGAWYHEEESSFFTGEFRADRIRLNTDRPKVSIVPFLVNGQGVVEADGKRFAFDVAFPILHGPLGEDGTIQGLFEVMGVPYVGSGVGGSFLCMDKGLAKSLARQHGIAVADFVELRSVKEIDANKTQLEKLGYPVFVKPVCLGSSVGITKVETEKDLKNAVEYALKFDERCLIEKAISCREIETAVLGHAHNAKVASVGEIVPNPKVGWYSYDAKYLLADGADVVVPAKLDASIVKAAQEMALKVFKILDCDGMARIDLFLEKKTNQLYFNESNTLPGFTPISMYPKMWQASGVSYSQLITTLLDLALK